MEFFIKKNATLPVLKINIIKDGRSDYDRTMRFLSGTDIFFSMVDATTGIPKITSRPAGLMEKKDFNNNEEQQYYVYYQFTPFDTKTVGRYKGQFLVRNETGILILPLNQEIYINVTDSFILDDMEYQSCYVVDFPCCKSSGVLPPPVPPITTTTTTINPYTTTTTLNPHTTTTTTIIPCVVCTSGVTLPQIGQTVTYNDIRLSAGDTLPSDISYSTGDTVMTCFEELQGPQTGSLLVGSNAPSPTQGSPFNYELVILDGPVNNLVFRLSNYNKTTGFTPSFTFVGQRRDGLIMEPTITACEYCCATISGNTIIAGDNTDCEMGSGYFRISTEYPYDRLQISGTGGNDGCYIDICQDTIVPPPIRSTAWSISQGVTDGRYFCDGDVSPFVTIYTEESATLQTGMQLFVDEYLTTPVNYLLNTSFFTVLARDGVQLTERYAFTIYGSVQQYTTPEFVNYILYCNQPIPCRELTITRNGGFPLVRWFDCNAQLAGQQISIGQTITVCGSFPIEGTAHVTTIGPNC
jgi:hypothetical protein